MTRPFATPTPLGIAPESRARFCNNQRVKQQQPATAVHTHTGESVHNTAPSNDSRVHSSSSETLLNAQRRLRAQQLAQLTRALAQLPEGAALLDFRILVKNDGSVWYERP